MFLPLTLCWWWSVTSGPHSHGFLPADPDLSWVPPADPQRHWSAGKKTINTFLWAEELLAGFHELPQHFSPVYFYTVASNHLKAPYTVKLRPNKSPCTVRYISLFSNMFIGLYKALLPVPRFYSTKQWLLCIKYKYVIIELEEKYQTITIGLLRYAALE